MRVFFRSVSQGDSASSKGKGTYLQSLGLELSVHRSHGKKAELHLQADDDELLGDGSRGGTSKARQEARQHPLHGG